MTNLANKVFSNQGFQHQIQAFLGPEGNAAPCVCASKDLYPFRNVTTEDKAREVFASVFRDPSYLQRIDDASLCTPAYYAFSELRNFHLASFYLESGGDFNTANGIHLEQLKHLPSLLFNYPAISRAIIEAKWKAAKNIQEQQKTLEWILLESCYKGNLHGVKWAMEKYKNAPYHINIPQALRNAALGGFENLIEELFLTINPSSLDLSFKKTLTDLSVEMGYPEVLFALQRHNFPVTDQQLKAMAELLDIQKRFEPFIRLPSPNNPKHNAIHGGDANKPIAEREYKLMVGYVVDYIQKGGKFRTLIENLGHRRRRMASLGDVAPLDLYGKPTDSIAITKFDPNYQEYGEIIRTRYRDMLPLQVKVYIGNVEIPLTKFYADRWVHPNGKHRDLVLDEVDRICEAFRPGAVTFEEEIPKCLGEIIGLISHLPPFLRGTPIVLRAVIDGCCLLRNRLPVDYRKDVNCEALTFDTISAFAKNFARTTKLPYIPTPMVL